MKRQQVPIFALALLTIVSVCFSQAGQEKKNPLASPQSTQRHMVISPDDLKWGPLPPGAEMAVLSGDPSKAGGLFTIRIKTPDGYKIPPHWHPEDEHITVIKGTFFLGMGEKFDPAAGQQLMPGSYALMPKEMRHFGWSKGETIVQVQGVGPFKINYVNPADDPGNKASSSPAQDSFDAAGFFKKKCAMCHKAEGKGFEAMHTPDFTSKEWQASRTDEQLIESVTQGKKDKGTMPPFDKELKPEEIKLLVTEVVRKFAQ